MTKKIKKTSKDQLGFTLFDCAKQCENLHASIFPLGGMNIDAEFRAAVRQDIKHAIDVETGREISQAVVAARMTDLLQIKITDDTLYNWTAPSHDAHNMPASYMSAFVVATGGQRRAMEVLSKKAGLFVLPGRAAVRSEVRVIDEHLSKLRKEKAKRERYLEEFEEK